MKTHYNAITWILALLTCAFLVVSLAGVTLGAAKKEIRMIGWLYQPSKTMEKSPTNLIPHNHLKLLAEKWEDSHPGVKITFVDTPEGQATTYEAWLVTQLAGGIAPDIVFKHIQTKDQDIGKGWFAKFDDYLRKPNPYVPGNKRWADLFRSKVVGQITSVDSSVYVLPVDSTDRGLFYNKEIFKKAGVAAPKGEWTLADFLQTGQKIKSAGYIPFYSRFGFGNLIYVSEVVSWAGKMGEMNVLKKDSTLDGEELVRAIKKGIYSVYDPRWEEGWRILKEISSLLPKDWISADAQRLFLTGKTGMIEEGSFFMPTMVADPLRTFEYGVLPYPHITKNDSPYGGVYIASQPDIGTTYAVTNTAVKNGTVDLAMDWLQFLTTPENNAYLVNEVYSMLPVVKGAKSLPEFEVLSDIGELSDPYVWFASVGMLGGGYMRTYIGVFQSYFTGAITLEQAQKELDKAMKKAADELIQQNKWEF